MNSKSGDNRKSHLPPTFVAWAHFANSSLNQTKRQRDKLNIQISCVLIRNSLHSVRTKPTIPRPHLQWPSYQAVLTGQDEHIYHTFANSQARLESWNACAYGLYCLAR